jgi:dihydroorotate dehydrogenase
MYRLLRPLLFALPPETAHAVALHTLRWADKFGLIADCSHDTDPVELMGLRFPNRIGLAAGFDKNGVCVDALGKLGFGFVELGTVTPLPQAGNPAPRLFRLISQQALINRMGFPNDGMHALCRRLQQRRYRGICGVNIGKNAATPIVSAVQDYVACLQAVYGLADYVVVNVSSPNTSQLRTLQQGAALRELLDALLASRAALQARHARHVPLLVKLSADHDDEQLADAARTAAACGIDGIVAVNSTVNRDGVKHRHAAEPGGLSGTPLRSIAVRAVQCVRSAVPAKITLIGVGGIANIDDVRHMRAAGADLVQLYTGLVYRGPRLVRRLASA